MSSPIELSVVKFVEKLNPQDHRALESGLTTLHLTKLGPVYKVAFSLHWFHKFELLMFRIYEFLGTSCKALCKKIQRIMRSLETLTTADRSTRRCMASEHRLQQKSDW